MRVSTPHAIKRWLADAADAEVGPELDLSLPLAVAFTARAAWRGPRRLGVAGQLVPPLWPTRGTPQGDGLAPAALCAALAPWQQLSGVACMGDRSIE
eukprot:4914189-Pyramimonas_sp.AAC.1